MKEIPSKDKKSYDRVYNSSHSFCFSFSKPAQMLCKVVRVIAEEVVKSLSLASPLPPPPPRHPKEKRKKKKKDRRRVLWCCGVVLWMDRTKQHAILRYTEAARLFIQRNVLE